MAEIKDKYLNELREEIDVLDNQLLEILERRFKVVEKVASCKKEKGLPIRDIEREEEVINSKCGRANLPDDFVKKLYRLIIDTAIKLEKEKNGKEENKKES